MASYVSNIDASPALIQTSDEEVRVEDEQGTSEHVRITGITSSGFLEAKTPEGRVIELHPDGNRFDFFRHLLTKKL